MYIADPLTSPLHRHFVSVCDDLDGEAKLKMPKLVKSIKAPFEAMRDYGEEDGPMLCRSSRSESFPRRSTNGNLRSNRS